VRLASLSDLIDVGSIFRNACDTSNAVQLEKKQRKTTREDDGDEPTWPDYVLGFDCESRITADQTLTFGFWRFSLQPPRTSNLSERRRIPGGLCKVLGGEGLGEGNRIARNLSAL
jgi:hypothetical protein